MIRRPPRSTHCISSAASDVYKRQVSTQSTWGIIQYNKLKQKDNRNKTILVYRTQMQFTSPPKALQKDINQYANQTLAKNIEVAPNKYIQAQQPNEFSQQTQIDHDPSYQPYEYEEALRQTAKKLRNQEKQYEGNSKAYKVPDKPYKPEWIDIEEFALIFKEMVVYEVKCEQIRVQLALQPDFRLPVLWRVFDRVPKKQKNNQDVIYQISNEDFVKGCRSFAIDPDPIDVKLLISKYKNVNQVQTTDITLEYQEFFAIFYPLSKGDLFDQKLNTDDTDSDRFFYRTNILIERALRMMLSQEDAYEYYRREIVRKGIDLWTVFKKINVSKDKAVNVDELRLFLIDYGLAVSKEDLQLFMMRLDKENNGKFNFEDFKREFTPRLGLKK
eukprot:TRINITY_DN156_c0_g1_i3.p1 TRINITY_DN156_c0_g1~~TRINITY_DN156_c0_g1_i3.p1  ORF type:complete len:386 (+),score=94.57 TRINITY_DN156_c0_g1_i3:151-1308(+)